MGLFGTTHRWGVAWGANQKPENFAISRNADIEYILIHNSDSFNLFWVFKDFFSKYVYNFDDVSINCYSRLS